MADNTDFTKKILIDVEVKSEQLKKDLPATLAEIQKLSIAQKQLSKDSKQGTAEFVANAQQLRNLKAELRDANKYIDNVAKAIHAETGTLQQQRAVLSVVTDGYVKMGEKSGVTAKQLSDFTIKLKDQEKEIEQTYRNVGNYTDALNKAEISLKKGSGGMAAYTAGLGEIRKGIGFLPQQFGAVTGQLGIVSQIGETAYKALSASVSQFNVVIKDSEDLKRDVIVTQGFLNKATTEATVAQEALAAGTIEASVAEEANKTMIEAQTAATVAQTAATEGATLATELFKVALASTGIGLIIIALAGLIAYFTSTNEGAKKFAVVLAEVKAVAQEFIKIIAPLGKAIYDTFANSEGPLKLFAGLLGSVVLPLATVVRLIGDIKSGNFKQAFIDAGNAVKQFGTNLKNTVVGAGETVISLGKNVGKAAGDIKVSAQGLKDIAKVAGQLTVERQKLTKEERIWSEEKLKQQGILDVLKLKIRDTGTTEQARIKAAKDAKAISDNIYQTDIKHATENAKLIEKEQALNSKKDYQAITDARNAATQITNSHNVELQSIQNRESRVEGMVNKKAKAAEAQQQKEAAAFTEAENIQKASANRMLQNIYEEYGDRAVAANQAYNDEHAKLKKLYDKKLITQAEYNTVSGQLTKEHESNIAKIAEDFRKKDYDNFIQADNELRNLQIANIENSTKREVAGLEQKGIEQYEALEKQNAEYQKNIDQLNAELNNKNKSFTADQITEIKARISAQELLLQENAGKQTEIEKKTKADILKIEKAAINELKALRDSNDVTEANQSKGKNSKEALDARINQLHDQMQAELSVTGLTQEKIAEIKRKYRLMENQELADDRSKKVSNAVEAEQLIQSTAFEIITQNAQASQQKAETDLQNRKSAELDNASLTNTQKKLIEQKYQKQDLDLKRKAFNDNKKMQAANILINGAVAISSALALPPPADLIKIGFIAATTAAGIAKTLSAKPGFAQGGQFTSDGKGALLSGYSRHDNTNARLRSGEAVVVSEAMRSPWARNLISDVNQHFGGRSFATPGHKPGFADGGIFANNDGGYSNRLRVQPIIDNDYTIQGLTNIITNMPRPVVDVKDIVSQVAILVNTRDRVNL